MKNILLLIISLFSLKAISQTSTYYPFPDSNAVWVVHAQGCCYNNCPPPPTPNPYILDLNFSYELQGDTIINGYTYHIIYQAGASHEHCLYGNFVNNYGTINTYAGAYRQDTVLKKVFFINYPSSFQECLLYDFSLNVGDTLQGGCMNWYWGDPNCIIVAAIDSVLIANNYRKKFTFLSVFSNISIIEGIGSTSGLLEPICPFEYWGTLICFSQNGQTLYPDTTTVCNSLTQINEVRNVSTFSITPNPFHTSTKIQTSKEFANSELILFNTLGKIVKQQTIYNGTATIHRDRLAAGIYFFQIKNDTGQTAAGKIIVE
ncbi:MAG: T9SS type A sorting domain-containing protein [Bacteroidia bacterium]